MAQNDPYSVLEESNLFWMSLHSKELFHSNFLAWIAERNEQIFKEIICGLVECRIGEFPNIYRVEREKNNFDLTIYAGTTDKDPIWLVLENKVKSIPYQAQLEDYTTKLDELCNEQAKKQAKKQATEQAKKPYKLLLSLIDPSGFISVKDEPPVGWIIKRYSELYTILSIPPRSFNNTYEQSMYEDYCKYIDALVTLEKKWNLTSKDKFYNVVKDNSDAQNLRIDDLREKVLFSKLCKGVACKLNKSYSYGVPEGKKNNNGDVFVDVNYYKGNALFEICVVKGDYALGVQIQNEQFRYFAKSLNGSRIKKICKSNKNIFDYLFVPTRCPISGKNFITKRNRKNFYCKYGKGFMYTYDKEIKIDAIKKDITQMTTQELIDAIVDVVTNKIKIP